jgi:hypothetical protein
MRHILLNLNEPSKIINLGLGDKNIFSKYKMHVKNETAAYKSFETSVHETGK